MNKQKLNRRMGSQRASKQPKQARQYHSKKVFADGIEFDSATEAAYYAHLKRDQSVELIEVQPVYQIIESYEVACKRCSGTGRRTSPKTGKPINCSLCSGRGKREKAGAIYTADFKVTYIDGYQEVVDVKGYKAERDFSLRKKLFEQQTGVELIVIRSKGKEWVRD